jgi:predicted 3'-5' exonuclease similar to PolB exonuclease domain
VNTYRVWLRYELFRGRLTENGLRASEAKLSDYIRSHAGSKPHLTYFQVEEQQPALGRDGLLGIQSETDGEIFIPDAPRPRLAARSGKVLHLVERSDFDVGVFRHWVWAALDPFNGFVERIYLPNPVARYEF